MRERCRRQITGGTAAAWLLLVATAVAQQAGDPPDVRQLMTDAYAKTKTAKDRAGYEEVISLCRQAAKTKTSEENTAYVQQLLSWALNRHGEALADRAAELTTEGKSEEAGDLDAQALADFEEAVALDPKRWRAIHNRGVSYAVAGEYEKALDDFDRTVEIKRDYANAWFNRGEIRFELEQYEQALVDYGEAIRLQSSDPGAYRSRGHCHFQLRRYREALSDYNRVVQLSAASAPAYIDRGEANRALGRWSQAASDFRRAIQLDGRSHRAYQAAAWLMATCPEQRYRDTNLAIRAAERARELSKEEEDFRLLDTLAAAYANAGRFEEAAVHVQNAIKTAPARFAEPLQQRLAQYQASRPFRESSAAASQGGR